MAKYTSNNQIEADVFEVSKEQKQALANRQAASDVNGVNLRKDGDTYYGLVQLANGETARVEEGSYLVKEGGRVTAVKSKEDFEAGYTAVKGKGASSTDEPVAYVHDISGDNPVIAVAGGGIDPTTPDKVVPHFADATEGTVPGSATKTDLAKANEQAAKTAAKGAAKKGK